MYAKDMMVFSDDQDVREHWAKTEFECAGLRLRHTSEGYEASDPRTGTILTRQPDPINAVGWLEDHSYTPLLAAEEELQSAAEILAALRINGYALVWCHGRLQLFRPIRRGH